MTSVSRSLFGLLMFLWTSEAVSANAIGLALFKEHLWVDVLGFFGANEASRGEWALMLLTCFE